MAVSRRISSRRFAIREILLLFIFRYFMIKHSNFAPCLSFLKKSCYTLIYIPDKPERWERMTANMEPLFTPSSARNSIEIETKYTISPASGPWNDTHRLQQALISVLSGAGCACSPPTVIDQTDHYFDTPGGILSGRACTLRLRLKHRAGAVPTVTITYKRPVDGCCSAGQMERYEYTESLEQADITSPAAVRFIRQYLGGLVDPAALTETILIENKRTKYDIKQPFPDEGSAAGPSQEESYELAFDSVRYLNRANGNTFEEQQIELELKSAPGARPHMQLLTNRLEEALPCLTVMTESKYVRAKRFTR